MNQCPFCSSSIEQVSFLTSPNFLVIYNQSPILPGHSLIIPRQHYRSLLDLPLAHSHELMNLSMHTVRLLLKIFNADGFDWTIQDGEAAGQSVMHLHLHLLPRYKDDFPNPGDWYPALMSNNQSESHAIDSKKRAKYNYSQLTHIASELKNKIKEMSA